MFRPVRAAAALRRAAGAGGGLRVATTRRDRREERNQWRQPRWSSGGESGGSSMPMIGGALLVAGGAAAYFTMGGEPAKEKRWNTVMPQPANPKYKMCVVQFAVPGAKNGGTDKQPDGNRVDSVAIANGVIKAGSSCELVRYEHDKHEEFSALIQKYDCCIVRINPGQLSQGTTPGTQERFDTLMNTLIAQGKVILSSPEIQTNMGAKDALCKIADTPIGLPDTYAYYTEQELREGFKKTVAFQPRVIKQNRGSAGEGIWLVWLEGKDYCKNFGDATADDSDMLKLMEMNDNHVERHTVKEFLEFCVNGPTRKAGTWTSAFPGKYLEGGKAAGGQLVDQRLLPRISEGEVRMLMIGEELHVIIHKKPEGGLSAVGGNSAYTYYPPDAPRYATLKKKLETSMTSGDLRGKLGVAGQPFPIMWTADFIPYDGAEPGSTEYAVGEFNCSCVGVSKFQAVCGCEKTMADVPDADYYDSILQTDKMGRCAVKVCDATYKKM